ncbi:ATP-binding protein, partial [Allofrancisella guangzhouensis]|uniref:AlbA family DNA-binding domain-containing protein n=1 Tax=Allofrancisella guangzhouensis TaxID=594679 RepID=UPI0019062426
MINRNEDYIKSLINELVKLPNETEWVEFKHNNKDPRQIGEYISALSNSSALNGKTSGYMVWGVDDKTHQILGTNFNPVTEKYGNELLENWLLRILEPKIEFKFYSVEIDNKKVVLLEINAAYRHPVRFDGIEYIRFGTSKKNLKGLPEKERELWRVFDKVPFEKQIAVNDIDLAKVLDYLEYTKYFE